jgi:multidrug efflux pump subunit AcrB
VEVTGGTDFYLQISYDAAQLSLYGITASDIEDAIRNRLGRQDIVGEVMRMNSEGQQTRTSLFLGVNAEDLHLESIPIKTVDGKIIYLNNLATCEQKERKPDSYYRVNGMNTVYMNVYAEEDVNVSSVASRVKDMVDANANLNVNVPVKVIKNGRLYIGDFNISGQRVK